MKPDDHVDQNTGFVAGPQRLPGHRPGIIFRPVTDGGVLLSTEDEVYFGLNSVGARIWELLPSHETLDELSTTLQSIYPAVDPATIRSDAEELLSQLMANRLVEVRH